MPEVEYEYKFYYRGDLVRISVYKDGTVVFDNAHPFDNAHGESHTMSEEEVLDLACALYNVVGPMVAK